LEPWRRATPNCLPLQLPFFIHSLETVSILGPYFTTVSHKWMQKLIKLLFFKWWKKYETMFSQIL
jgi:hypothetical protein